MQTQTRVRTRRRIGNDDTQATRIVSLEGLRASDARPPALIRDWGPASLAAFFTTDVGEDEALEAARRRRARD